jgi:DNA-binding beta-propeller fold protein YncE
VVFDPEGTPAQTVGDVGSGAGKFMRPRGVAFDCDGHLYVTDAYFNIFQVLETNGQALMPVGTTGGDPGQFQVPAGIAIDKNNRIFVADQLNARIQAFRYVTDEEAAKDKAKLGIKDPEPKNQAAAMKPAK